jgi:hypothetical protein
MKNLFLLAAIFFISTSTINAQWWSSTKKVTGNGDLVEQIRNLTNYDAVTVTGMMEVELIAGREGKILIEAESNLMEHITTEVVNGTLKISVEKGFSLQPSRNLPLKLTVPVESIGSVSLTGSGEVYSSTGLTANNFRVNLTGSGDVTLNLEAKEVAGVITGSGNVTLKGKTGHFSGRVTGSGDLKAYELTAKTAEANVSGSGDIELQVQQELKARITGSGDINYKGNPQIEDFKSVGSGSVTKR